ncbi:MAG: hypothetical protein F2763_07950 [Actinobacteria bacterium]|uniref:Unannotated protein n=1 Tax=freshwater metagenome TaxID=449393 RepID=A0A6J7APB6_9ZZZZ|nr:hypothetical protein [Actinomycetota bacterium]
MPLTDQPRPPLTRRQILARSTGLAGVLAGAGVLSACGSGTTTAGDTSAGGTTASPVATGAQINVAVAISERALIAIYTATIGAFAQMAPSLEPLLRQHEEHLAATGVEVPDPPTQNPPSDWSAAIAALRQAELTAALERRESCLLASEPDFVRTLTFIAASEASHVAALKTIGRNQ